MFDPLNPGERQPKEIGKDIQTFIGDQPDQQQGKMQGMQLQSSQNYNVSVSGKIEFFESSINLYKSVYGNGVVLWFRNSSDPGTWYHPVYSENPIQGTHYDKLDEQGNFSFNFSFTGDLSGYDELIVLVNTANNAAIMPAPQDGYISWGNGYTAYFNESEGLQVPIDPNQTNITVNENGEVNSQWGRVLRYSELSKEFIEELYSGNMTFSVPAIPTRIEELSDACGTFYNSWSFLNGWNQSIEIDPLCTTTSTVSHEFGHWTHYRMWTNNSKWNNAQKTLKEGFAIFYSFAVRNYANRNYGDDLRANRDNTEEAPFLMGSFQGTDYRYRTIGYAHPENDEPAFAAAACYMWNLYDDPEDDTLLAAEYSIGDNDDISGYSLRVFEKMRTLGTTTIQNYNNEFQSGLSTEEQNSIDLIYDFMFDDLYEIPSVNMHSAQVDNFSGNMNSESIDFSWQSQSYPSHLDYANTETGYRLYQDSGSGWQLIQTLPEGTTNYTYESSSLSGYYRITSYNSEGNSANAPVITFIPSVYFTGPTIFYEQQGFAEWTANPGGGVPPYSYQWRQRTTYLIIGQCSTDPQWQLGTTNQTMGRTWSDGICSIELRVTVTDEQPQSTTSAIHKVFYESSFGELVAEAETPQEFALDQNHPNPFNPATTIRYQLPEAATVSLAVYNMLGRRVATLVDGQQTAGFHTVNWDGSGFASGLYFLRMQARGQSGETFRHTRALTLVK